MGEQAPESVIVVTCYTNEYEGDGEMVGIVYDTEALRELVRACKHTYPQGYLLLVAMQYRVGVAFPEDALREGKAAQGLYRFERQKNGESKTTKAY